MTETLVLSASADGIGVLTLNNPSKRNALSTAMLQALKDSLASLAFDQSTRVVVIKAGGTVFSAGHDLRELVEGKESDHRSLFQLCTEVMEAIRKMPQPVIAMVNGLATAAGCQLVAGCDLALASEESTFATPGVKIGLFCTTPGVAVSRVVPSKKAMEMLLTGTPITAQEAERIGLINRVVAADQLESTTMGLARQIAAASYETVALGKAAFYRQIVLDYDAAYEFAVGVMVQNALMDDAKEGMRAFLEKRQPVWKK